jgi:hypothetical protein
VVRSWVVQVALEEAADAEPCSAELSITGNVVLQWVCWESRQDVTEILY